MDSNIFDLIKNANEITLKKHGDLITLERAVFLSWWCDKGDCAFCYMSTQKDKIKDPAKARRNVSNIYAEAEMCKRLDWNIEFLSGGYKSFTTQEIKEIATTIKDITGDGVWLNTGITDELQEYGSALKTGTDKRARMVVIRARHRYEAENCFYLSFSKSDAGCLHSGQMKSAGRSSPS